jgi:hypothetical protein
VSVDPDQVQPEDVPDDDALEAGESKETNADLRHLAGRDEEPF